MHSIDLSYWIILLILNSDNLDTSTFPELNRSCFCCCFASSYLACVQFAIFVQALGTKIHVIAGYLMDTQDVTTPEQESQISVFNNFRKCMCKRESTDVRLIALFCRTFCLLQYKKARLARILQARENWVEPGRGYKPNRMSGLPLSESGRIS